MTRQGTGNIRVRVDSQEKKERGVTFNDEIYTFENQQTTINQKQPKFDGNISLGTCERSHFISANCSILQHEMDSLYQSFNIVIVVENTAYAVEHNKDGDLSFISSPIIDQSCSLLLYLYAPYQ